MPSIGASMATAACTSARTSPVWIGMLYGSAGGRPGLVGAVDQQPPHLLERHPADDLLDVDTAVAQCGAFLVGLGDLGLEGDHALQCRGGRLGLAASGMSAHSAPDNQSRHRRPDVTLGALKLREIGPDDVASIETFVEIENAAASTRPGCTPPPSTAAR